MTLVVDTGEVLKDYLTANPGHAISTTLAAEASAAAESFTLTSGAAFSAKPPIPILIGSELFLGSVSGNTLTLKGWRGAFGTTAAVHANASAVHQAVLYDLIEDRFWVPSAQEGYANAEPAIVAQPFDRGRIPAAVLGSSVLFKCYPGGGGFEEARAMFRLLHERLHNKQADVAAGGIIYAELLNAQPAGPDDREGWIRHIAQFEITVT